MNEYKIKGAEWCDLDGPSGSFRIMTYRPSEPEPETGFPVIYVLDGNVHFTSMIASMKAHSSRPQITGLDPSVIVAIGYPIDDDYDLDRRSFDLTPFVPLEKLGERPDGLPPQQAGGAEQFLKFIEQEIRPKINADFPVDTRRQSLFGHSYGGLFTLFSMLTRPALFQNYLASSPSIWFGDKAILSYLDGFKERVTQSDSHHNLFLSVGAFEQTVPPSLESMWPAYGNWIRANNMIGNLQDFVQAVKTMELPNLSLSHHVISGEHHGSVPPVAINKSIPLALKSRVRKGIFDEIFL
ncbi:alpha/beta hydrolase [Brucellaceae bacterium C25G]